MDKENMTASEAVFGFGAWLTGRKDSVTLGEKHDASIMVQLIREWLNANDLPDPREDISKQY